MDRDLVERARNGDHAAFALLVRASGSLLYGIARRVTGDAATADDAVQEALIMAWRDLPTLRDPTRFESWLTQILVRRCYREISRRRPRADLDAAPSVTAQHVNSTADRDELERGFRRLSAEQRAVLVLRYYADLEPLEIAETLGIPAGTVRSRIHYALQAMRSALDADARPTDATQAARQ
jgi:RNA polymerase sigma-70 factor (ECF subfamily)